MTNQSTSEKPRRASSADEFQIGDLVRLIGRDPVTDQHVVIKRGMVTGIDGNVLTVQWDGEFIADHVYYDEVERGG